MNFALEMASYDLWWCFSEVSQKSMLLSYEHFLNRLLLFVLYSINEFFLFIYVIVDDDALLQDFALHEWLDFGLILFNGVCHSFLKISPFDDFDLWRDSKFRTYTTRLHWQNLWAFFFTLNFYPRTLCDARSSYLRLILSTGNFLRLWHLITS